MFADPSCLSVLKILLRTDVSCYPPLWDIIVRDVNPNAFITIIVQRETFIPGKVNLCTVGDSAKRMLSFHGEYGGAFET